MPDPLWINANSGTPAYTATELRQAMGLALMHGDQNVGARTGVRPGGTQLRVTLVGTTITVEAGLACISPDLDAAQGPYWIAIPAGVTHTLTAAHATNPRKDIVVARVYDDDEDTSGLRLARTEYIAGVAGPAPTEPAVPDGATRLATIDVPASGGGSPVVTDRREYTVAAGGVLPIRDQTQQDAVTGHPGLATWRIDTKRLQIHDGTGHLVVADAASYQAWQTYAPTWTQPPGGTQPSAGNATLTGRYFKHGRFCMVKVHFKVGSTSTLGNTTTGEWSFSAPFPAAGSGTEDGYNGSAYALDVGTSHRIGNARLVAGSSDIRVFSDNSPGGWRSDRPFTWVTGDYLTVTIGYETSS